MGLTQINIDFELKNSYENHKCLLIISSSHTPCSFSFVSFDEIHCMLDSFMLCVVYNVLFSLLVKTNCSFVIYFYVVNFSLLCMTFVLFFFLFLFVLGFV